MNHSVHFKSIVVTGMILSLSVGLFDSILTTLTRLPLFSSFGFTLAPLAKITFSAFLFYSGFSLVLRFLLLPTRKIAYLPACFAGAIFFGVMFILTSSWIFANPRSGVLTSSRVFPLVVYVAISLFTAALTYFSTHRMVFSPRIIAFLFSIPFLLAETWIAEWFHLYRISSFLSWQSAVFTLFYLAVSFLTFWFIMRSEFESRTRLVFLLLIVVVVNPVITWSFRRAEARFITQENGQIQMTPVILITIDTLRADELSILGSRTVKTPNMDSLGSDGLIFKNAFSTAPWTLPSVVSILTGSSPLVHHVTKARGLIPDGLPTLAERLHAAGYYTGAVVSNPYLVRSNLYRGFHEFQGFPKIRKSTFSFRRIRSILKAEDDDYEVSWTPELTSEAVNWLQENHRKNFFFWIHYLDPHLPYSPDSEYLLKKQPAGIQNPFRGLPGVRLGSIVPSESDKEGIRELYEGEVRFIDHEVGKVLSTVKKLGLYGRALIVLTSDHGEEFWEHNGYEHGHALYNEILHVPLILKLPHSSLTGTVPQKVATSQVTPTIMSVCRVPIKDRMFAASLLPADKVTMNDEPIIATGMLYFEPKISLIFDNFKYIKNQTTNAEELYDLNGDFAERKSLTADMPDQLVKGRIILDDQYKRSDEFRRQYKISDISGTMDEATINQLRAIGYVQ